MYIGIDGDHWYCSNGMCLGDPRAKFVFKRTLREAVTAYQSEFQSQSEAPENMHQYLGMTPEEYLTERDQSDD